MNITEIRTGNGRRDTYRNVCDRQAAFQFGPAVEQVLGRPNVQQELAELVASTAVLGPSQIESAYVEGLTRVDLRIQAIKEGKTLDISASSTGMSYERRYRASVQQNMLHVVDFDSQRDPHGRAYLRAHIYVEFHRAKREAQSLPPADRERAVKEAEIIREGQRKMFDVYEASLK